jgi:triosephosphate isomerase
MINRKKYCVANFKMHKTTLEVLVYIFDLWKLSTRGPSTIILCPPITSINLRAFLHVFNYHGRKFFIKEGMYEKYRDDINGAIMLFGKGLLVFPGICAQNIHHKDEGAFTGEVSAKMVKDSGATYVLLGHSERRTYFNETNEQINKKIKIALDNSLTPIFCIGETLEQRKENLIEHTLKEQIAIGLNNIKGNRIILAYEPVWAIGTGETATSEIIIETHQMIRKILNDIGFDGQKISILYGGSMNRNNAKELIALDDVDGFLVGGASLDVEHFADIYKFFKEFE